MNNLFLNVLTISVLSSFLILTVIIIRSLFKKLSKNYICLLWGLTALRLMTTFSFKTEFGIVSNTAYIRRDIYNVIVSKKGKIIRKNFKAHFFIININYKKE